jgi:hypothetical protein
MAPWDNQHCGKPSRQSIYRSHATEYPMGNDRLRLLTRAALANSDHYCRERLWDNNAVTLASGGASVKASMQ